MADIADETPVSVILTCHVAWCENYNAHIEMMAYPNEGGSIWAICGPCGTVIEDILVLVD